MSYFSETIAAIDALTAYERALVVISAEKSSTAMELGQVVVDHDPAIEGEVFSLVGEDGEKHDHLFMAHRTATIKVARSLISAADIDVISRETLQRRLGMMFGYEPNEIDDFVVSEVGKTCPCDCCGGTPRSLLPI